MKAGSTKGCCKDETKPIKTDREHQQVANYKVNHAAVVFTDIIHTQFFNDNILPNAVSLKTAIRIPESSPDDPVPRYILNCIFRI